MQNSMSHEVKSSLLDLYDNDLRCGIRDKFSRDESRYNHFSFDLKAFFIDLSKTHISEELINLYHQHAEDIEFVNKREQFFSGDNVNVTEKRPALHALLRDSNNQGIPLASDKITNQAKDSESQFLLKYSEIIKKIELRPVPVTDIIHVGIGGSSLGSQLLYEALSTTDNKIKIHFLGNIDGHQLKQILIDCNVDSTLVIGVSKTFTTSETLQNLNSIKSWFDKSDDSLFMQNCYAVTASIVNAKNFGIETSKIVEFPEWVGGRYSVWSSVSLSVALVIGMDKFAEFLQGGRELDSYFYNTDLKENCCFITACLDHYYTNFFKAQSRAVFAYDFRCRSLVNYLQQLETESNGKDRQVDGTKVDQLTSPIVWGGVGTDAQHSVFQMLHQGTVMIPTEFLLIKSPDHDLQGHHDELLANGLAQSAALLKGRTRQELESDKENENKDSAILNSQIFSGERPSTTILIERLNARTLGSLLAFYEHRTFCSGLLSNINSFDQMGVELGKNIAKQIKPCLIDKGSTSIGAKLDASTLGLIDKINQSAN